MTRASVDRGLTSNPRTLLSAIAAGLLAITAGCGNGTVPAPAPQPRAVSVFVIQATPPESANLVTGVAGAWKTEDIGFEVSGRVKWVIEPDQDIESELLDADGKQILKPTQLAMLASDRYELAVESARAQVEIALRKEEATKIEVEQSVLAQIASARAETKLAEAEQMRTANLVERKAATEADLDSANARLETARAGLAQYQANLEAKKAELKSRDAEVNQARQTLAEAERDLADCKLFSSFRGQVAQVHVVPGSVVSPGTPAVTVQMMDPIKVEIQLSAAKSRSLSYRDLMPVTHTDRDGNPQTEEGFVYMSDTAADPQTRTFTVTLLVRNRKIRRPIPARLADKDFARTTDIWRVNYDFVPGANSDQMYVEKRCIQEDDTGSFVWRVGNRNVKQSITEENRVMEVSKVYIEPGEQRIPFLGNWVFRPFTVRPDQEFDPATDIVTGQLTDEDGEPVEFDGEYVFLDTPQWLLRPGDLVQVDLSGEQTQTGLYVPIDAVVEQAGKRYVFVVDGEPGSSVPAKRVEVTGLREMPGGLGVFVPADGTLQPGTKLVAGGVHYIRDGETLLLQEVRK